MGLSRLTLRPLALGTLALGSLATALPAQAGDTLPLSVNGQPSARPAIILEGETYIPLSSLKQAGVQSERQGKSLKLQITSVSGGTNQVAAVEGHRGDWLFDSVWRVKAGSPTLLDKPFSGTPPTPGWGVEVEIRNGSKASVSLAGTSVDVPTLALADGSILRADEGDWQQICFTEVLPGASLKHVLKFWFPYGTQAAQAQAASRLVIPVDTDPKKMSQGYKGVRYTTKDATFRIQLK